MEYIICHTMCNLGIRVAFARRVKSASLLYDARKNQPALQSFSASKLETNRSARYKLPIHTLIARVPEALQTKTTQSVNRHGQGFERDNFDYIRSQARKKL